MSTIVSNGDFLFDPRSQSPENASSLPPMAPSVRPGSAIQGVWFPLRMIRRFVRYRNTLLVAIHTVAFALILPLAYFVRFDGAIPAADRHTLLVALPWVVAIKLVVFLSLRSHRGWWRYATFSDIVALAESTTIAALAIVAVAFVVRFDDRVPRSVLALDWAGTLLVLGGLRCSTRLMRQRYYPMIKSRTSTPVLVVGTSDESLDLVRLIQAQQGTGNPFKVVGLLGEHWDSLGRTIGSVTVVGQTSDVARVALTHHVQTVLVPTPSIPPRVIRELVTECHNVNVRIQVVPNVDALLRGSVTVQPRDVDIHDLLCREVVKFEDEEVAGFLEGRVVLVTGAAGSIGSEICRQVLAYGPAHLVLVDHSENGLFFIEHELRGVAEGCLLTPVMAGITDAARMRDTFDRYQPDVVFHAAAHKHVPMMEANCGEAVKNNVFGTRVVVDEAVRANVDAFVMISTDKAVRPSSVMVLASGWPKCMFKRSPRVPKPDW